MPTANAPAPGGPLVSRFKIDLTDEAGRLARRRLRVVATGVVLGVVFITIGIVEVGVLAPHGATISYAIALLLVVLGVAVAFVSVNSGLINPVTSLRGNATGITFERRWGGARSWSWSDPDLRIDIDDRTADPTAGDEARQELFFEGPAGLYGALTPTSLSPLLDTARTYGAAVSTKQLEEGARGRVHLVKRIRVRPRPLR